MTTSTFRLPAHPVVRAFAEAINNGDRAAFMALLTPGATMTDDGSPRDLAQWADHEIFDANGRFDVRREEPGGLGMIVKFGNDTWGAMNTRWDFTVQGDRISRFDTGQA
ncbi:nuclear transport factor 2 family protein [Actinomadura barringtoniae]|uniref:Nuclear transport factor 2 family protein n=1 Tax=Actinomadura barringtoniae TaxID=1427535 RepID=A0A939TFX3_9ACTN|nr:nuclear transport factor 2 family protein [Actinomadura barringtoniae]MBO2454840.1 nuclear transport factor 2 family protein [Actinomadura barringtoniae]